MELLRNGFLLLLVYQTGVQSAGVVLQACFWELDSFDTLIYQSCEDYTVYKGKDLVLKLEVDKTKGLAAPSVFLAMFKPKASSCNKRHYELGLDDFQRFTCRISYSTGCNTWLLLGATVKLPPTNDGLKMELRITKNATALYYSFEFFTRELDLLSCNEPIKGLLKLDLLFTEGIQLSDANGLIRTETSGAPMPKLSSSQAVTTSTSLLTRSPTSMTVQFTRQFSDSPVYPPSITEGISNVEKDQRTLDRNQAIILGLVFIIFLTVIAITLIIITVCVLVRQKRRKEKKKVQTLPKSKHYITKHSSPREQKSKASKRSVKISKRSLRPRSESKDSISPHSKDSVEKLLETYPGLRNMRHPEHSAKSSESSKHSAESPRHSRHSIESPRKPVESPKHSVDGPRNFRRKKSPQRLPN